MQRQEIKMRRNNRRWNRSEFNAIYVIFIFIAGILGGVQLSSTRKAIARLDRDMAMSAMAHLLSFTRETPIYELLRSPVEDVKIFPKTNKTIAACMLAMDDSIRLAEWLAYHYTILPLGSLMIAVDPDSQSQKRVLEILDLWKDRINIIAYTNDSEWMPYKYDEGWGRRIYRENGKLANWLVTKKGPVYRSQSHKRRQNAFV